VKHLFVTNDFPPKVGGIESYVAGLASGFEPEDVVVVAPARAGHEQVDVHLPYPVVRLGGSYLRARRSVASRVSEIARSHRVDVVHFTHTLPLGRLGRRVRKATGLPFTVFVHGSEVFVPSRAPLLRRVVGRTLNAADAVVCVSEYTASRVRELTGGRTEMGIVPPSVDVDRFSLAVSGAKVRESLRLGGRFVVLFVSRLVKRKGADTLLQALKLVPDVTGVFVGSGPEEQALRRLAGELELGSRAVFAGRVPDAALPQHYAAADIFCMPCSDRYGDLDTEGFGIVYLEAAASGLAAIAGRCGGSAEAVLDGVTGIVLDGPDPAILAKAITRLRDDEATRVRMGAAGRDRVCEGFTPIAQAARLEDLVARLSRPATSAS